MSMPVDYRIEAEDDYADDVLTCLVQLRDVRPYSHSADRTTLFPPNAQSPVSQSEANICQTMPVELERGIHNHFRSKTKHRKGRLQAMQAEKPLPKHSYTQLRLPLLLKPMKPLKHQHEP